MLYNINHMPHASRLGCRALGFESWLIQPKQAWKSEAVLPHLKRNPGWFLDEIALAGSELHPGGR